MKVYVKDQGCRCLRDATHKRKYQNVELCPCCMQYRWTPDERKEVQQAIDLVWLLVDFEYKRSWKAADPFESDPDYNLRFSRLVNPLREPFEYDSDNFGLLAGVLTLAALAGTSYIRIETLKAACLRLSQLQCHISNDHLQGEEPSFELQYPPWLLPDALVYLLPHVRGMSYDKIREELPRVLDQT